MENKYKIGDYVIADENVLKDETFEGIKRVVGIQEGYYPYELQDEPCTHYTEDSLLLSDKTIDDLVLLPYLKFMCEWAGCYLVKTKSKKDRDLVQILGKSKDGKSIVVRHIDYVCETITLEKAFKNYRFEDKKVFGRETWK